MWVYLQYMYMIMSNCGASNLIMVQQTIMYCIDIENVLKQYIRFDKPKEIW